MKGTRNQKARGAVRTSSRSIMLHMASVPARRTSGSSSYIRSSSACVPRSLLMRSLERQLECKERGKGGYRGGGDWPTRRRVSHAIEEMDETAPDLIGAAGQIAEGHGSLELQQPIALLRQRNERSNQLQQALA